MMQMIDDITAEEVRRLFYYDGADLRWRRDGRNRKAGDVAGCMTSAGYRATKINNRQYKVHRLIWLYVYGEWPNGYIDHINRIRNDNRIANLRVVDCVENGRNRRDQYPGGTRGSVSHVGVCRSISDGKFYAQIAVNGERIFLGSYENEAEAIKARRQGERKYWNADLQRV